MGKKEYKPKKRSNHHNLQKDVDNLPNTKRKQWVVKAVELLKQSYSPAYIREHISANKEGAVTINTLDAIMAEANDVIRNEHIRKNSEIIALHLKRYNSTINRLNKVEELDQDLIDSEEEGGISYEAWMKSRERKIKAGFQCLETMRQKEELLQFHSKDFHLDINIEETVEIRNKPKQKLDIHKLTLEEKIELWNLMKKGRLDENALISVTEAIIKEDKVDTIDIDHEEVEPANVEQIKQEQLPAAPYISPVTKFDPTVKLREALKKVSAKKIASIGGNMDDIEKQHLED